MPVPFRKSGRQPAPVAFVRDLPEGGTLIATGITGYGKTHWLKRGLAGSRHLYVINTVEALDRQRGDTAREHWDDCDLWTFDQLLGHPDPLLASPCRVVIDLGTLDEARAGVRASRLLELLWSLGDADVVLEECGGYSRWATSLIARFATAGGHNGLRLFVICQNYRRITVEATSNVQRLMLFPQAEEADMTELRKKIGRTKEAALRSMQRFDQPVLWQQGQLEGAAP